MPRPGRILCPLSGLAAGEWWEQQVSVLGIKGQDTEPELSGSTSPILESRSVFHLPAGGGQATAVVGVCESSCSCCRSSTSLAADALCTYLATDSGALQEFCGRAGGLQALQVKGLLRSAGGVGLETRGPGWLAGSGVDSPGIGRAPAEKHG